MEQLTQRINDWLWPERLPEPLSQRLPIIVARHGVALLRDVGSSELRLRAMGLVYTTMLSTVPLLALSFSVLKGFGYHRQLQPLLLSFLEPLGPRAEELTADIIGFVDNVSGSAIASVSLGLLLFTALSMAQKVEDSFNFVWRVDRPRSFARRFSEYLSVLLVGPMLMTIAMGLTASVTSTTVVERLQSIEPFGSLLVTLGQSIPYLLVIGAFSFLYAFVPNTTVRVRSAVFGGLLAGVSWAATGELFAEFVAGASRTEAIYSGFAIVIVAMIWLYISWLILLLGAQFAFYHQNPEYLALSRQVTSTSNELRERLAMSTMLLVATDFDQPGHGWREQSLAAKIGVPRHQLEPIVAMLTDAGLLATTTEQRLVPGKALRRISLAEILHVVRGTTPGQHRSVPVAWNSTIESVNDRINAAILSAVAEQTLADLVADEEARQQSLEAAG